MKKALGLILTVVMISCTVAPQNIMAATTKLNKKSATIYVGKTVQLKLKNSKGKVTWKSSKKSIATVTTKGKVKGVKAGKVKIYAKNKGEKYICNVTVKKKNIVNTPIPTCTTTNDVSKTNAPNKITQTEAPKTVSTTSPTPIPTATPNSTPKINIQLYHNPEIKTTHKPKPFVTPEITNEEAYDTLKNFVIENGGINEEGDKYIGTGGSFDLVVFYDYKLSYVEKSDSFKITYIITDGWGTDHCTLIVSQKTNNFVSTIDASGKNCIYTVSCGAIKNDYSISGNSEKTILFNDGRTTDEWACYYADVFSSRLLARTNSILQNNVGISLYELGFKSWEL